MIRLLPFLLGTVLCFSQVKNTDSLKVVISKSKGDAKAELLLELAKHYQYFEPDSICVFYADQAIMAAKSKLVKGKAFYRKAHIYRSFENDLEQLKYFQLAFDNLKGQNDSIAADAVYYQSRVYQKKGMYPEALRFGYKELEMRKKLSSKIKLVEAYQEIGFTYDRMGDYLKAIEWHKKSLEEALKQNDNEVIGRAYGLIGIAYDELNEFDKALEYNFIAVDYFKKTRDSRYLHTWYSNIGNTYTKKRDFLNAEKYTLLALSDGSKNRYVTKVNLGKIYVEQGKYDLANEILKNVLEELIVADDKRILSEAYYRLHELRKKEGNFKEALDYFEKYKINEDEMLNEAKLKLITEMSTQYETSEKEKALVKEKIKVAERELNIKNKNNWLLILGIFIITIASGALLYINQQHFKNKQLIKEKQLSEALLKIETNNRLQEQRLAISRDLHDNIGAQLTFIISSVDSLKMMMSSTENKLSEKLTGLSSFTRDTIQELRDTIWAMNKDEISIEDLKTRISNFIDQARAAMQGIDFTFNCNVPKETLFSSKDGMNLYRIIQEATNNAIKHANGTKIDVTLNRYFEDQFEVVIEDNGIGFSQNEVQMGNGLLSLNKRAKEINGKLEIIKLKQGTQITLKFEI